MGQAARAMSAARQQDLAPTVAAPGRGQRRPPVVEREGRLGRQAQIARPDGIEDLRKAIPPGIGAGLILPMPQPERSYRYTGCGLSGKTGPKAAVGKQAIEAERAARR